MKTNITSILFSGFRATGKSTVSRYVATDLGWEHKEMDEEIVKLAGRSIPEITSNGKEWQEFRELETALLKELSQKTHVVISAGGGAGVNNHINKTTGKSFGEEQTELIKRLNTTMIVLLTAPEHIIAQRMEQDERAKESVLRPILDPERAHELEKELTILNTAEERKRLIVRNIVEDSLNVYRIRAPLYNTLSSFVIDTSSVTPEQAANKIKSALNL